MEKSVKLIRNFGLGLAGMGLIAEFSLYDGIFVFFNYLPNCQKF